jgi:hypothetical protein
MKRRRLALLKQSLLSETIRESEQRVDHYVARTLAGKRRRNPQDVVTLTPDTKSYVNCCVRYCGLLQMWVGWCKEDNTYTVRCEGFPEVVDIVLNVRNPASTKTYTRAARYALAFLEQHGALVSESGGVKLPDGRWDVTYSPS